MFFLKLVKFIPLTMSIVKKTSFSYFDVISYIYFLEKMQADCNQVRGREYLMLKGMREILKNLKY